MKNLFTILFSMFTMSLFAQNGNMIFFTEDNENFTLMVNSITINTIPSNNVRVDNRPMTRYKVVVKFQKTELGTITDNVTVAAGSDKTFVIKPRPVADIQAERVRNMKNPKTKNNYVAKYAIKVFSTNPIVANPVSPQNNGTNNNGGNMNNNNGANGNMGVDMNVNPNGVNMNTGTGDPMNPNINVNVNPNGISINGGGINVNASGNPNGQTSSSYSTTTTTTTTTTTNNGSSAGATWSGCASPLSPVVFQTEERKVRNQTTEAGKIITAQQMSTNYCLTSAQIKTLCTDIFSEKDRLAFAEFAYPRCYDPANFSVVYSAFYINANVVELNNFVNAYAGNAGYNNNTGYNNNSGYNNNNGGYNNNGYNNNNGGGYVPSYNGPYGCPVPMNATDFNAAKESISKKGFENTKLEIAKQVTDANCFTAQQIKEMVMLFDFEATKLEYAKYAYSHCYDKNNYYKVNDAFTFEASMTELSEYVKGK